MVDEICCISTGRTGSIYLTTLIRNCKNTLSLGEIFNKNFSCKFSKKLKDYIFSKHSLHTQSDFNRLKSKTKDYMKILRDYKNHSNKDLMFYKIFLTSNQIKIDQFEKHYFGNDSIGFIYLGRNPLHIYISMTKAKMLKKWFNVDTSKIKIEFNPSKFLKMFEKHQKYFELFEELCKKYNKKYLDITYEEIVSYHTHKERLEFISKKFNEYFDINLQIPETVDSKVKKQDKSKLHEKVTNYNNMVSFLKSRNLSYLLTDF